MTVQDLFQETIAKFDLYDDMYFGLVFSDEHKRPLAQLFLRVILGRDDIVVRTVHVEHTVPSLLGRGIRMDVMAIDDRKTTFDIEFQRNAYGASPQRARFNASVIDANYDLKGIDPRELHLHLPETYVIFITETDVLGEGRPIYHVDRTIVESGRPFGDGSHIVYVNGAFEGIDTPLGKLIHDFRCTRADDMLLPQLAARTRELKETKRGAREMSERWEQFLEDMREEIRENMREEIREEIREDMREEIREDMRAEFYDAGKKDGRKEGKKQGIKQGKKEGVLATLFGLVIDGLLPPSIAAARASMPEAVFKAKMAEYQGVNA